MSICETILSLARVKELIPVRQQKVVSHLISVVGVTIWGMSVDIHPKMRFSTLVFNCQEGNSTFQVLIWEI